MRIYAGVGSRKTPPDTLKEMTRIASVLAKEGYTLRSGGAMGADSAFEAGANNAVEIFVANDAMGDLDAMALMEEYHPAPRALQSNYVRHLMARNGYQILGRNLVAPVDFVLCWTPDGADGADIPTSRASGGTGQAIRIAAGHGIPVINMMSGEWEDILKEVRDGTDRSRQGYN